MQGNCSPTVPDSQEPLTTTARRVESDLAALPFGELLRYWQRLNWWTGVWPLFRHMTEMDLTLPEIMVLRILMRRSLNVAEVAYSIAISQSAASRAVERLVSSGLISRHEDPEDRRNKRLTLTSAGAKRNDEIERNFGCEFADLVNALTPGEQGELRALFARLLASFVDLHADNAERTEWARELGCTASGAVTPETAA